jgi:hypothetical protein
MWRRIFSVVLLATAALLLASCGSGSGVSSSQVQESPPPEAAADTDSRSDPTHEPAMTDAAVLEYMQLNFPDSITAAEIDDDGTGSVRVDIHTDYYPDSDARDPASGIARIAAQLQDVVEAYDEVVIETYVWPQGDEFYMTRATAHYQNGRLVEPMDVYVNSVLE